MWVIVFSVIFLMVIALVIITVPGPSHSQKIKAGGFQGFTVENQGIEIGSSQQFIPIGSSIPSQGLTTFNWNSGSCFTVNGATIGGVGIASDPICVSLGNSNGALLCKSKLLGIGSGATCPTIKYSKYIKQNGASNYEWQTVTGEIQDYNVTQTFAVQVPPYNIGGYQSTSSYSISWITSISDFVWNLAYSNATWQSWQGGLYMAPLYSVTASCLESVTASNPGQGQANQPCNQITNVAHDALVPKGQGYSVPLSTSLQFTSSLPNNGFSSSCTNSDCVSQVNSTLSQSGNAYSPSSLLTNLVNQPVYYQIAFSDFGPYGCGFLSAYTCAPVVTLNYQIYTLTVGTYLVNSTNPNTIEVLPPATSSCPSGSSSIAGVCFPGLNWGAIEAFLEQYGLYIAIIIGVIIIIGAIAFAL